MLKVYVETSAANFFLSNLNGMGAEATRKLQLSKGREWYISTTVLWELFQIRDQDDLDACMYLSSYLFSDNLLKSASELIIDYIEQGEPDYLILDSPYTKCHIGPLWKKACDDKGYTFFIDDPIFRDATKFVKEISKYLSIITIDAASDETPSKGDLSGFKEFIEDIYNQYFSDNVDELVKKLRTISILVLFIQLGLGLDITRDVIEKFWETKAIKSPYDRLSYLLERHPDLVRRGPVWNIANAIFSQCMRNRRSSRGAFHDGMHAIYLPIVDVFLTQDDHFRKLKEISKKEFGELYNKIHHIDEFRLVRVDQDQPTPNQRYHDRA